MNWIVWTVFLFFISVLIFALAAINYAWKTEHYDVITSQLLLVIVDSFAICFTALALFS